MTKMLDEKGIRQIYPSPYSKHKVAFCERAIRTLRELTGRIIASGVQKRPHLALKRAVKIYNSTENSVTKLQPENSFSKEAQAHIIDRLMVRDVHQEEKAIAPRFRVGQIVRLRKGFQQHFIKSGSPLWREPQFRVSSIIRSIPMPSYQLSSIDNLAKLPSTVTQSMLQ